MFRLVSKTSSNNGYFTTTTTLVVVVYQHHQSTTTTAIKISCVAIYAVLLQNQLCRELRVFGVKFLNWKWCWCLTII